MKKASCTEEVAKKRWTDDDEKDLWNSALQAAVQECHRLERLGKDDHLKSWMGNAIDAIYKLYAPVMDEPRDQY